MELTCKHAPHGLVIACGAEISNSRAREEGGRLGEMTHFESGVCGIQCSHADQLHLRMQADDFSAGLP